MLAAGSYIQIMECVCALIWFHWLKLHWKLKAKRKWSSLRRLNGIYAARSEVVICTPLRRLCFWDEGARSDSCDLIRLSHTLSGLWSISGLQIFPKRKPQYGLILGCSWGLNQKKWSTITNSCRFFYFAQWFYKWQYSECAVKNITLENDGTLSSSNLNLSAPRSCK